MEKDVGLGLIESLERWGTQSMTEQELLHIRTVFGDRADELLRYYDF